MPLLQRYMCSVAEILSDEDKSRLLNFDDNLSQIKYFHPFTKGKINYRVKDAKNFEEAEALKTVGNELFSAKQLKGSIAKYNEALFLCPQNCDEGKRLRAILIANRSAAFFELQLYEKVVKDVELVHKFGHHPNTYKLNIRAAKSCIEIKLFESARNFYEIALKHLDERKNSKEIDEINKQLQKIAQKNDVISNVIPEELAWKSGNEFYPCLSSKVTVESSAERGRFVVATEDIKAGEIIGIERPFFSAISKATHLKNCAFCCVSTDQIIVCESCSSACFCSLSCLENARKYHQYECQFLHILYNDKISVNHFLALRWITMHSLSELKQNEEDALKKEKRLQYRSDDYQNLTDLVSHGGKGPNHLIYIFTAYYMLHLLKLNNYFGGNTSVDILSEDEALVGSWLLRNLETVQFNAHEIGELLDNRRKLVSHTIGAGVYPTLALFNHSCNPSMIRYNIGNVLICRSKMAIKAGEEVCDNYGPWFVEEAREHRRAQLFDLYRFRCECIACREDWPLFKNLCLGVVPMACKCGSKINVPENNKRPIIKCKNCKKDFKVMNSVFHISNLCKKFQELKEEVAGGKFEESIERIVDTSEKFNKYLVFPYGEGLRLVDLLSECFLHRGNKNVDYNPKRDPK